MMGRRGFAIGGGPRFLGVRPAFYLLPTPAFLMGTCHHFTHQA